MSIAEEVTYYVKGEIHCADNKISKEIENFGKSLVAAKNEEVLLNMKKLYTDD